MYAYQVNYNLATVYDCLNKIVTIKFIKLILNWLVIRLFPSIYILNSKKVVNKLILLFLIPILTNTFGISTDTNGSISTPTMKIIMYYINNN